ncbi:MAG: DUF499 domain-containing protein [Candidatus Bathyarchaeia archaeon]
MPLEEFVKPSEFTMAYKDLEAGEYIGRLAPSLGLIVKDSLYQPIPGLSREFKDPERFLLLTNLNEPILNALKVIDGVLATPGGEVELALTHEMGFGKTHFLTLLWHLYTEVPSRWKDVKENPIISSSGILERLTVEGRYRYDTARKTLVFVLDMISLPDTDPYTALFETSAKIVEKYSKLQDFAQPSRLAGDIRSLAKLEPLDAAKELARRLSILGTSIPVLVLLDELYAGVYRFVEGADERGVQSLRKAIIFVASLVDELAAQGHSVAVVYASAMQDVNIWASFVKSREPFMKAKPYVEGLVLAVEHFEKRASRVPAGMPQLSEREAVDIIARRLLQFDVPRVDASKKIGAELAEEVKKLTDAETSLRYYYELIGTYPFTPTYMQLVRKLLTPTMGGDLPRSQHLRDLLKVTASIIASMVGGGEWGRASLISPGYVRHDHLKHLLDERYSLGWRNIYEACQLSIAQIGDAETRLLADRILSIVYTKSITTNVFKLLDMLRSPEALPRSEVLTRGTSTEDIVFSLVGVVLDLSKLHDAREYVAHSTPRIVPVEYGGREYLLMSFIFNPFEFIRVFRDEELSKLKTLEEKVEYFRRHLETEHTITGKFKEESEKRTMLPRLELVDYSIFQGEKPRFLDYIDGERFTVLVVSPWDVVEEVEERIDCVEEIRGIVKSLQNEITYKNMFAVVIPSLNADTLQRLCGYIAEVYASRKVVDYFKDVRKGGEELVKRSGDLKLWLEEERGFEDLMAQILSAAQRRVEEYCANYTNRAVQNYASELVKMFDAVVYYDPTKEQFVKESLVIEKEKREKLEAIYAELPLWLGNAVKATCNISTVDGIKSSIIEHVIKPEVRKNLERLSRGEKIKVDTEPIINVAIRGWKGLPVKPVSKKAVEGAITVLSGSILMDGNEVRIGRLEEEGKVKIVIEFPPKPPERPMVPRIRAIQVTGGDNVVIATQLLGKEIWGANIKALKFSLTLSGGGRIEAEGLSPSLIRDVTGEEPVAWIQRLLTSFNPYVESAFLSIELISAEEREKVNRALGKVGVDIGSVTLREVVS